MALVLKLDTQSSDVDRAGYLDVDGEGLTLTRQVNGRGELSFVMKGPYGTLQPDLVPGLSVLLQEPSGTSLFAGVIDSVEEEEASSVTADTNVIYRVDCISFASWLDRRIVRRVYENQLVGEIMDDLIDNWIGSGATDDDGFTEGTITTAIHDTAIPRLEALYVPVSEVLDQIAKYTGAVWSVSPTKAISIKTIAAGTAIPDRNIITSNQGFETGDFTGWSTWGTPDTRSIVSSAGTYWEGSYGYLHEHASGADNGSYRALSAVVDEDVIVCSVYCKCISTSGAPNGVRLEVEDASVTYTAYATGTGDWERLSVSLTSDGDAPTVRIGGQGRCYFDAAQVEYDVVRNTYPSAYTTTDAVPKDAHNIVVTKDRDRYFNRIYALTYQRRKDFFTGDNSTQTFTLPYDNIAKPEITVTDASGAYSSQRRVSTDFDDTLTVVSAKAGEAFAGQPSNELIAIVSDDAGDTTQDVTIIGATVSGADFETITLNGTTPVNTTEIFNSCTGVVLSEEANGTVSLEGVSTTTAITSISSGTIEKGVYSSLTNNTNIWVSPTYVSSGATTNDLGLKIIDALSGSVAYTHVPMTGTTPVQAGFQVAEIQAIYLGDIPAGENITIEYEYEWEYAEDSPIIQQNTNTDVANTLGTGETLHVEYHGLLRGEIRADETSEQTARATAEGGSGVYEHIETIDDIMTTSEVTSLASEMIDLYARDGATSYFPRVYVTFDTWDARYRTPGDNASMAFAKHAITATTMYLSEVRMRRTRAPASNQLVWLYSTKWVTGRVYGDWAEKFKAMLPTRRVLYSTGRLLPR